MTQAWKPVSFLGGKNVLSSVTIRIMYTAETSITRGRKIGWEAAKGLQERDGGRLSKGGESRVGPERIEHRDAEGSRTHRVN